ncbi:uncharacterized protein K460DRAFT_79540 [Cucurbitaria berberidis CBS 394.84]|uniref:Uncharacterized protein n=1 Tax=Cucurbitaria berberidis CBS 394.84 TaxID=1168544 RepID=A0A9P4LC10_9PLEO|nr:uncharacterized protein K460DRAFT_79540 [Cucurbitaria berberidis CBS 394.84]KAF1848689.1 hypothetical protein K460DRAFT_79540 [Cucurbitaria berberidis CBS 394.84]
MAERVSAGRKRMRLCGCTTLDPRYWVHWIPTARQRPLSEYWKRQFVCGCGWLLRVRQESVTWLGPLPHWAKPRQRISSPQLAGVLSGGTAGTSNTRPWYSRHVCRVEFTLDWTGIQQRARSGDQTTPRPSPFSRWCGSFSPLVANPADMTWLSCSLESPRCTCSSC